MPNQDRWNEDRQGPRERAWPGETDRAYGAGDYEYDRGGAPRRAAEDRAWRPYDPGRDGPDMRDRGQVRWQGGPQTDGPASDFRGDRHERSFLDRAADEVAAWWGDRDAEVRRARDGQHRGRGPRGYRRSDARISDDVHDHLTEDSWLDASDIEVDVRGGEVSLRGHVRTRDDRHRAAHIADRVFGVMRVHNHLHVDDRLSHDGLSVPLDYLP